MQFTSSYIPGRYSACIRRLALYQLAFTRLLVSEAKPLQVALTPLQLETRFGDKITWI